MAAVDNLNQWDTAVGGDGDDSRVVLGAVMLTTAAVVVLAANVLGPAAAATAAAAMFPVLFVATLRAPLGDCSIYASLAPRR
jgi:hypothetical protein